MFPFKKNLLFFLISLISAFLISIIFPAPTKAGENSSPLVINEIGAYEKEDHEWIEIFNRSEEAVDLTGWKFWENETNHGLSAFLGDLIIEPDEYAIIAEVAENFSSDYPAFQGTIIDSAWSSLKEDGEEIGLKNAAEILVELFTYLPTLDFSLERKNPYLDDYRAENWQEHPNGNSAGFQNSNFKISVLEETQNGLTEDLTEEERAEGETTGLTETESVEESLPEETDLSWEETTKSNFESSDSDEVQTEENSFLCLCEETGEDEAVTEDDEKKEEKVVMVVEKKEEEEATTEEKEEENEDEAAEGNDEIENKASVLPGEILISEFLPNPGPDGKEWIEFYNPSDRSLDLSVLTIADNTEKPQKLSGTLNPNDYLVFLDFSFNLNNSGDLLILKNGAGEIIDQISYGENTNLSAPEKGVSLGLNEKNEWQTFLSPTPGEKNQTSEEISEENNSSENQAQEASFSSPGGSAATAQGETTETSAQNGSSPLAAEISVKVTEISAAESPKNYPQILISEIFPNPSGPEDYNEWIELFNPGDEEVNLENWILDDAEKGSKAYALSNLTIEASDFLVIPSYSSHLNLNNSGDEVRLFSPDGTLQDSITYEETEENLALIRMENEWGWSSSPTPHAENLQTEPETENMGEKNSPESSFQKSLENSTDQSASEDSPYQNGDLSSEILITEILPNPEGSDRDQEWIEIKNAGEETINLGNWFLDDEEKGSKPFIFSDQMVIEPSEYLLIPRSLSQIALNNKDDQVRLFDFEGELQDEVEWEKTEEGMSYALIMIHQQDSPYSARNSPLTKSRVAQAYSNSTLNLLTSSWEWTLETTPGASNPSFEIAEGVIGELSLEESPPYFYLDTFQKKLKVNFELENVTSNLAATFFQPGIEIKTRVKKLGDDSYELKDFEILGNSPAFETDSASKFLPYFLILIAGAAFIFLWLKKRKIVESHFKDLQPMTGS